MQITHDGTLHINIVLKSQYLGKTPNIAQPLRDLTNLRLRKIRGVTMIEQSFKYSTLSLECQI